MWFRMCSYVFGVCLLSGLLSGCVKDVDFEQAKDISLSPDIQLNLLMYNVNEYYFLHPETGEPKTRLRDTIRLEFLDDEYIQNSLTSVEFKFRHVNTFEQPFYKTIKFLSISGHEQFRVEYDIAAGSKANPKETEHVELIEEDRIDEVRNSFYMVVELGGARVDQNNFSGELDFASKGFFMLDF